MARLQQSTSGRKIEGAEKVGARTWKNALKNWSETKEVARPKGFRNEAAPRKQANRDA